MIRLVRDRGLEHIAGLETENGVALVGEPRQERAVGPDQRRREFRRLSDAGVEVPQAVGRDRHGDDPVEAAVDKRSAAAEDEELGRSDPSRNYLTDESTRILR